MALDKGFWVLNRAKVLKRSNKFHIVETNWNADFTFNAAFC